MGWQRLDETFHNFLFDKPPFQAAVHQLTKSLASDGSGLPKDCLSVALLPVTLDTPMNRSIFTERGSHTHLSCIQEVDVKSRHINLDSVRFSLRFDA